MSVTDSKIKIDHKDGDGLNNQRSSNLRIATDAENQHNRKRSRNNTIGYRGVWIDKRHGTIYARIKYEGKRHYLGPFDTAEEASAAYEAEAKKVFGSFYRSEL